MSASSGDCGSSCSPCSCDSRGSSSSSSPSSLPVSPAAPRDPLTDRPNGALEVFPFNVGGSVFLVGRATLERDPTSSLFAMACALESRRCCAAPPPHLCLPPTFPKLLPPLVLTREGHMFVDRDPQLFRHLLNLLRGYRCAIPPELFEACRDEAAAYGLTATWERRYPPEPLCRFVGGGTSDGGRRLTSHLIVSLASPFLTSWVPDNVCRMCVAVETCDFVGVGVVSRYVRSFSSDVRTVRGCAVYYSGGEVHFTPFPQYHTNEGALAAAAAAGWKAGGGSTGSVTASQADDGVHAATYAAAAGGGGGGLSATLPSAPPQRHINLPQFESESLIDVAVDFSSGIVTWRKNHDVVDCVRLWGPPYSAHAGEVAFAVVLARASQVRVVDCGSGSLSSQDGGGVAVGSAPAAA